MTRRTIAGLCLVAALSAVTLGAVSAQAAETFEYARCVKAAKAGKEYAGSFSDKSCSVAQTAGKYELMPVPEGSHIVQKGVGKKATIVVPALKATIECASSKYIGQITGPKTGEGTLELKGCSTLGKKCTGVKGKAGAFDIDWGWGLDFDPPETITFKLGTHIPFLVSCGEELEVEVQGDTDGHQTGDVNRIGPTATGTWSGVGESLTAKVNDVGPFPAEFNTELIFKSESLEVTTTAKEKPSAKAPTGFVEKLNNGVPKLNSWCTESPGFCGEESKLPAKAGGTLSSGPLNEAQESDVIDELDKWCAAHPFQCGVLIGILLA